MAMSTRVDTGSVTGIPSTVPLAGCRPGLPVPRVDHRPAVDADPRTAAADAVRNDDLDRPRALTANAQECRGTLVAE